MLFNMPNLSPLSIRHNIQSGTEILLRSSYYEVIINIFPTVTRVDSRIQTHVSFPCHPSPMQHIQTNSLQPPTETFSALRLMSCFRSGKFRAAIGKNRKDNHPGVTFGERGAFCHFPMGALGCWCKPTSYTKAKAYSGRVSVIKNLSVRQMHPSKTYVYAKCGGRVCFSRTDSSGAATRHASGTSYDGC